MRCLHCGDCCLRMSPLSPPDVPCPKLVERDGLYFCGDYENRPEQCANHDYPSRYCPVGVEKLKLKSTDEIGKRVDTGFAMLRYPEHSPSEALALLFNPSTQDKGESS